MKRHFQVITALLLTATIARAQTVPQSQPDPAQQQQQMFESLPWAVRLGLRSHQVSQAFPLVDRVVLVPDAATYLDELGKWSPRGRWPVLIEDSICTPMFVRRFAPAQLVRRPSINQPLPMDALAKQKQLEAAVVRAFDGDPATMSIRQAFDKQQYVPPGIVIASVNDPAWTAAVALAAGHGQPLAWLDDEFAGPNDTISHDRAMKLIEAVNGLVAAQNYPFQSLGDAIDTLTICRWLAVSADYAADARSKPPVPAAQSNGPLAITDLLGRNPDGTRYAYTGWIFGDEIRSAYVAMCSLFLPREQISMFNGYPLDGPWSAYSMTQAITVLRGAGYSVRDFDTANADEHAWQRMIASGVSADLFIMNSKGNNDFFELFAGRGTPGDVPVLNQPLSLHLIHSWSMQHPADSRTVGGRWLEHGAYAAVGSCWEPMLSGFVPPTVLSKRISSFVPFLIAARWWDGEPGISQPWRVVTIGDPLMVAPPLEQAKKPRISLPVENGLEDLNQRVKSLIRQVPSDQTGKAAAEAIGILNMLGKDTIALEIWKLASQKNATSAAARPALDVLFRTRNEEEFRNAWRQIETPDALALDMLWHMGYSKIAASPGAVGENRQWLLLLKDSIRPTSLVSDVQRIAPLVARSVGLGDARIMIQQAMNRASDSETRNQLAELLKQN